MLIDFPTILFLAALVMLIIWIIDTRFFYAKRCAAKQSTAATSHAVEAHAKQGSSGEKIVTPGHDSVWVEYSKAFFPILILVLILRSWIGEPFRIPSDSMVPTLLNGDFIYVNKLAYGARLPMIHKPIFGSSRPTRGEVFVFRYPEEPTTNYIKRVIGVPGDVIEYKNRQLTINGVALSYKKLEPYYDRGAGIEYNSDYFHFQETINDRPHVTLTRVPVGESHETLALLAKMYPALKGGTSVTVPKGYYFAMGDNRDRSYDGRMWGLVPESYLVGRAVAIWFNVDPVLYAKNSAFKFWTYIRWERMFTAIK